MTNGIASETNGITPIAPCPFCGSNWLYQTQKNGYGDYTPVMFCNSCKAVVTWEQVEEEGVSYETSAFVRERWNTRVEDAESEMAQRIQSLELEYAKLQEELREAGNRGECVMVTSGTPCAGNTDKRCTSCGASNIGEFYDGQGHIVATPRFCPNCGREAVER